MKAILFIIVLFGFTTAFSECELNQAKKCGENCSYDSRTECCENCFDKNYCIENQTDIDKCVENIEHKVLFFKILYLLILLGLCVCCSASLYKKYLYINSPHTTHTRPHTDNTEQLLSSKTQRQDHCVNFVNIIDTESTCSICLDTMFDASKQQPIISLNCNHYFHKECIELWLTKKQKCPVCNTNTKN